MACRYSRPLQSIWHTAICCDSILLYMQDRQQPNALQHECLSDLVLHTASAKYNNVVHSLLVGNHFQQDKTP